jgi:hypothetical protein
LPALTAGDFGGKGAGNGQKAMKALQRLRMGGVNVEKILSPDERADKTTIVAALEKRLYQASLNSAQEQTLREFLDAKTKLSNADIVTAIRLMMSTPEYQVT